MQNSKQKSSDGVDKNSILSYWTTFLSFRTRFSSKVLHLIWLEGLEGLESLESDLIRRFGRFGKFGIRFG